MEKSNKELAVVLAVAVIEAIGKIRASSPGMAAMSGKDVNNILADCYKAVSSLESGT